MIAPRSSVITPETATQAHAEPVRICIASTIRATPAKIREHLGEVEATRQRAFASFTDDACLLKHVAVPSGGTRPLIDLLLETLLKAASFQTQALVTLKILSGISTPGFII